MNKHIPYHVPKNVDSIMIQFVSGKVTTVLPETETITVDDNMLYVRGEYRAIEIMKDKVESIIHVYK